MTEDEHDPVLRCATQGCNEPAVCPPGSPILYWCPPHWDAALKDEDGTLRHSEPVEVVIDKAISLAGADVLLVATRWQVDGADERLTTTQGGVPA